MKRSNSMLSLVILLLLKSASYSYAQTTPDSLIQKMDTLFKNLQGTNRPGCAVAIISNGSVVFKKGYGLANLEHSIPLTTSSIFDIASVSKQFTGLAVSMLIQQGRISPDDDIRQYLPEIPQFAKTITIRHLLHHTSGIRDWPEALGLAGWREGELFAFKDIMRMVKYQRDLNFEPGSEFLYSNTGYNLLAAIVEKVTGKSFRTWTGENIFQPLGMNASHFSDDHSEVIKNLAASYILMGNGFHLVPDELTAYGSSSLYTSIDDLCKWVINFQKSISDHDPVYIRMLDQGKLNNGDTVHYGYGLGTGNDRGLKVISHNGSWAGYRTEITNYPDPKLSIIL